MTLIRHITFAAGLAVLTGCKETSVDPDSAVRTDQDEQLMDGTLTINDIESMPKGFEVSHFPREVAAIETGNPNSPYRWEHKETVTPLIDNLTVQEFGYIVVVNGEPRLVSFAWDRKPYDRADFSKLFACEDDPLKKGKNYTRTDWTENESLEKSEMTPYFVGVDGSGKRYSGYSSMTKLSQLKTDGEQDGAGQPATRSESKSDDNINPQAKSKGRSQ